MHPPLSRAGHDRSKPVRPKRSSWPAGGGTASVRHTVNLGTENGVADRASPRQEQVALRLERDGTGFAGDVDAIDEHLTRGRADHAGHDPQQRRLPTAARAHDADELPGIDRERNTVEHPELVIAPVELVADVAQLDGVVTHAQPDGFGR